MGQWFQQYAEVHKTLSQLVPVLDLSTNAEKCEVVNKMLLLND